MELSQQRISYLFQSYLDRSASCSELQELTDWLADCDADALQSILEGSTIGDVTEMEDKAVHKEYVRKNVFKQITAATQSAQSEFPEPAILEAKNLAEVSIHRIHFLKTTWFRYAALLLLITGIAAYLYNISLVDRRSVVAISTAQQLPDASPGANKAVLTLSDGSTIALDSAAVGDLASQGSTRIVKLNSGELTYQSGVHNGEILYNTISTPKGSQYQVSLPDGSKVWLNAASSIRFPTSFSRDRKVSITGEVYFDISPDNLKPFTVSVQDLQVKVLGTTFNINAYENEQSIKTTLASGSVQILAAESTSLQQEVVLQPGQQARWAAGTKNRGERKVLSIVSSVEIDKAIAWKQGLFDFNGVELEELMRQIERWYGVDVVYENGIPDNEFVGKIYRSSSLPTLLKAFESANIRFRTEGRKIVVLNDPK